MDMTDQPRLFRLAVEALNVHAHFEPGYGWVMGISVRRQGEGNSEGHHATYRNLTTSELVDVICAELLGQLGL